MNYLIKSITGAGMKVAFSLKPGTAAEVIDPNADQLDRVLAINVEPGKLQAIKTKMISGYRIQPIGFSSKTFHRVSIDRSTGDRLL